MNGRILTILNVDGTVRVENVRRSEDVLERAQRAVGGYIEIIPGFTRYDGRRCVAYANDTGRIDDLPENARATELWRDQLRQMNIKYDDDYTQLFGNVVIDQVSLSAPSDTA